MLTKCCSCIPLRTGSIIIAILGLLSAIATLVYSGGSSFYLLLGTYYLIAEATLLFGAIKYNKRAMLVYLVCSTSFPIIDIVFGIIAKVSIETIVPEELASDCASMEENLVRLHMTCDEFKSLSIFITVGYCFIASLMNIYFWLCNYSFYKELNEGRPIICLV